MSGDGPPIDASAAATAFGRFRVLHQIGTGSLGPIFRGEDTETDERVAIKHLKLKVGPERTRFIAEDLCALIEKLPSHPAVPRELHAGTHAGDPYLVYALAAGESLDAAVREYGPAVIADALPRLERLAEALDQAAAAGICHGALHPHDVIVSARETKLTGLGVAGVLERAGVHVPSRAPYSAPEVEASHQGSPAGDQYALAALAYIWLTGQTPSVSMERPITLPPMPNADGEQLAKAFETGLAADPSERFPNCAAFVAALRDAARASPQEGVAAAALPFESEQADEPAGAATLTLAAPANPPRATTPVVELRLDAPPAPPSFELPHDPPSVRTPVSADPDRTVDPDRSVKWRGSLSSVAEPESSRAPSGFSLGALVAVLVAGIAIGIVGGYLLAGGRTSQTARVAETPREPAATAPPAVTPAAKDVAVPASANATPAAEPPATHAGGPAPNAATPAPKAAARHEAAPPARHETARLLVRTSPAGASVTVDGTERGKSPIALRDLDLGTRTIVISHPGYVSAERRITLTADRPSRSIDVSLAAVAAAPKVPARPAAPAAKATAGLIVDSRPAGANVTIDGTPAGTTPLTIPSIAPGSHKVVIEKDGYQPWVTTVDVKPGERPRVAASLQGGNERE